MSRLALATLVLAVCVCAWAAPGEYHKKSSGSSSKETGRYHKSSGGRYNSRSSHSSHSSHKSSHGYHRKKGSDWPSHGRHYTGGGRRHHSEGGRRHYSEGGRRGSSHRQDGPGKFGTDSFNGRKVGKDAGSVVSGFVKEVAPSVMDTIFDSGKNMFLKKLPFIGQLRTASSPPKLAEVHHLPDSPPCTAFTDGTSAMSSIKPNAVNNGEAE